MQLENYAYNKYINLRNYIFSNKILLNNRYIKIIHNYKLEDKYFTFFCIFYQVKNQAYKIELSNKKKVYNIFYQLLQERNMIMNNYMYKITLQLEFETKSNSKNPIFEKKGNNMVYRREFQN